LKAWSAFHPQAGYLFDSNLVYLFFLFDYSSQHHNKSIHTIGVLFVPNFVFVLFLYSDLLLITIKCRILNGDLRTTKEEKKRLAGMTPDVFFNLRFFVLVNFFGSSFCQERQQRNCDGYTPPNQSILNQREFFLLL